MATADTPEKASPPYIPFGTFANFVDRLKNTAIPDKIDNTVMPNLAGGVRGQVRSALRFLGLTDAEDHVNTTFRDLIQAHGSESWYQALGAVIDSAYAPILNGLDLQRATPGQLQGKFKAIGMTGQMAEKVIRFLLAAHESAGRPLSPHLTARSSPSGGKGKPRAGKPRQDRGREREADQEEVTEEAHTPKPGVRVRSFTFPVPGESDIRVVVPDSLDDPDVWGMVNQTLLTFIRLNARAKAKGAHRGPERGEQ
jgi:hypothetical protein